MNFFKYENPLFLDKDLISVKQDKNEELVNNINDGLIDLKKADNKKHWKWKSKKSSQYCWKNTQL